jgi:predicted AlkP superfamily phosphohydrolase/phosphomutase/tetratricopeptide (TPR) repeat protein
MIGSSTNRVLLIGWDAADWKVINPIMDAGLMPALNRLVNDGVIGNLATLDPPLSPMLWTSIATGKTADQHGVLGFVQPDPETGGIKPVLGTSRKSKALWNILTREGLKSGVVGWWPTHPAEPIKGVMVSNFFQQSSAEIGEEWPVPRGSVFPAELEDRLATYRVHPGELTASHVGPFVPLLGEIDQEKDNRPGYIANTIAHSATVQSVATYVMEHEPWDLMAVYFDAIDHLGHGFMRFHPPQQPGVPDDLYRFYSGVVTAGYMFHDMLLDRLLGLAGPETTVILLSDHGFHSDHLRPEEIPHEPAGPAVEHRRLGIFCMRGPGVKKDERIYGAGLLDIAPTVLATLGLPIGRDMPGKVLSEAFEVTPHPVYIDSWESVDGDFGMHPEDARSDPWAEQEAVNQLIELGYVEGPDEDTSERYEQASRESRFFLSRVYASTGRVGLAVPVLEQIVDEDPKALRYSVWLLQSYLRLSRTDDARRLFDELGKSFTELPARFDQLKGVLLLAEGRNDEALQALERAEGADPAMPTLHLTIGRTYLRMNRLEEAERAFRKALTIDIDSPDSHLGLAMTFNKRGEWVDAAEAALRAVALRFHQPLAHYQLGLALMRLGDYERSSEAFRVCVKQAPGMRNAHLLLSEILRIHLDRPREAQKHLELASEKTPDADSQKA